MWGRKPEDTHAGTELHARRPGPGIEPLCRPVFMFDHQVGRLFFFFYPALNLYYVDVTHSDNITEYLLLPGVFRLTNLRGLQLELLTGQSLMGNDDTDGLTAILPSGHLEQLSWWLIEKENNHRPNIDFCQGPSPPLSLHPVASFYIVLTLNLDLNEMYLGVIANVLSCPLTELAHKKPPPMFPLCTDPFGK